MFNEHVYGSAAYQMDILEKSLANHRANVDESQAKIESLLAMLPPSPEFLDELRRRYHAYTLALADVSGVPTFIKALYADAGLEMPKTE